MAAFINTNISSLNSQRNLNSSQTALTTSLQRLSSGLRINSAKDDAAGLAISERMTSQIRGNDQAARNANDGISLAQTAEGDLTQIGTNLQRIRELAVQAANGSNSASDRASLNNEASSLIAEIDRVASSSSFNGNKLLDGTFTAQSFQVGANNTSNDRISIDAIASAKASSLGVGSGSSYSASKVGTGNVTTAALTAGELAVNGYSVGASTNDGVSFANADASGIAKAAAINAVSSQTGVTATTGATAAVGQVATAFGSTSTGDVLINGVDIGAIGAGTNAVDRGTQTAAAINAKSAQTGVTASADATGIVSLAAADGRNITVKTTTAGGAGTGLNAGTSSAGTTTTSKLTLTSSGAAGITVGGTSGLAATGQSVTFAASTATAGAGVSSLNLTTAAGAQSALSTLDSALATVNNSRASLGAYQNRFASVVTSLQTTSENLSASRSRIQDTDFAKETASLTRGQILQQAGTAMLAQANSLPNGVLALLRG
ncbi:flagellin [Massilia eurypsychrophila]|uniref:Flagellin n=1 Tax=Massilia eurypsychrophila TaxID=1485217 RepID=A0A2G8TBF6_9BURK|nr:flagellin [Massilia eurypsychrophila]PIL43386.1 flagellin [Massilia eurypsychrophila]